MTELYLMCDNFIEPIAFEISIKYRELDNGGITINSAFDNKLENIFSSGLARKHFNLFGDAFPLPTIAKNTD